MLNSQTSQNTAAPANRGSMLAKLLATENITFQHSPTAKTASFDVKNRMLILPVWKDISPDLYDMLVVHEVGHALDTKYEDWVGAIKRIAEKFHGSGFAKAQPAVKGFLNVVEDIRIDKRQKRRYPGSRRNYIVGYKELIERDFFGTANRSLDSLSLIDRLNMYFKGGALLGIKFTEAETVFLERARLIETWAEAESLAEDLYRFAKENQNTPKLQPETGDEDDEDDESDEFTDGDEGDEFTDGEEADEGEEGDESTDGEEADEGEEGDESTDGEEADEGDESTDGDEGDGGGDETRTGDGSELDDDFIPESETDSAWEENASALVSDTGDNYVYYDLPEPNIEKIVDSYKVWQSQVENFKAKDTRWDDYRATAVQEKFKDFKNSEKSTISYMLKEFETRKSADLYARVSTAKTGVIDTNKLHSYKYNDDIFRRLSITPAGKSHGFIMFLDWSGSMTSNMSNTIKQLMSLVMFCKRAQIPFEVYNFRSLCEADIRDHNKYSVPTDYFSETRNTSNNPDKLVFQNFKMKELLSSRMSTQELDTALFDFWCFTRFQHLNPMLSTPLNQAILTSEQLINNFRKRNKLQIVNTIFLTDGAGDGVAQQPSRDGTVNVSTPGVGLGYKTIKNKFFIRDSVTKKEYVYHRGAQRNDKRYMTNILLRILKDRTNCNLIGMFLYDGSNFKSLYSSNFTTYSDKHYNDTRAFWKANKFVSVDSTGYDEYYVIDSTSLNDAYTNKNLSISSDASASRMSKEFSKFLTGKTVNRVLLKRFIENISSVYIKKDRNTA
jgi:hypothetical protein